MSDKTILLYWDNNLGNRDMSGLRLLNKDIRNIHWYSGKLGVWTKDPEKLNAEGSDDFISENGFLPYLDAGASEWTLE